MGHTRFEEDSRQSHPSVPSRDQPIPVEHSHDSPVTNRICSTQRSPKNQPGQKKRKIRAQGNSHAPPSSSAPSPSPIPSHKINPASQDAASHTTTGGAKKKRKLRVARKHAFVVTDAADHAETPGEAFEDIVPILTAIARDLGKPPKSLKIYDPFFCHGGTARKLRKLGFEDVYNKNEDWYAMQTNGTVPDYDVLLTNPPFSADHIERLLGYCHTSEKPWLLLQPAYVMRKPFFKSIVAPATSHSDLMTNSLPDELSCGVSGNGGMLYLTPDTRYTFLAPPWLYGCRKKTSPFVTVWYCHLPESFMSTSASSEGSTASLQGLINGLRNAKKSRRLHVEASVAKLPAWTYSEGDRTGGQKR